LGAEIFGRLIFIRHNIIIIIITTTIIIIIMFMKG
jgi:hypothetical protein